ncbi:exo-alpha-sialidase [Pseudohongiella sp.]|uniref:Thioredoxin domain-containing protein n=1 Tax=marine sediment metagenome TaxID=412755 RepID=A0A0F9W399_9ZZZZ|nr:exo-alpha-sialidase [Pseudohongiella sp.]HDZ08394.1 exo-alpha-sialidase [Pseudohongiella sp.]HEA62759.1 exo-alpha-sialidase [Pseudohongiella sp.]
MVRSILYSPFSRYSMLAGLALLMLGHAGPGRADEGCVDTETISVHCGQTPSAHYTSDGRLWVVFEQYQHAYVAHSDDHGDSYSPPVRVNGSAENIETNGENRPKILVDQDLVYVSWTQKTEGQHTGDIRFSRSTDGGQSFAPVRTINDDGLLTSHRFDSLFLASSGHLYLTWLDKRELEYAAQRGQEYTGSGVFYAVSDDQGQTFTANRKVADHSCECCRIAVAPYGDDGVALMWRHVFDGTTRDHAIAAVGPEGVLTGFSRATVDEWQIDACPHHGPDMALSTTAPGDDVYHMTWFSAGDRHKGIYYGRHELTSGATTLVRQIDGNAGASHPQIAEWQGVQHLVWKRFDGAATQLLWIYSRDDGANWSEPQVLASTTNASDHPLLIRGPDSLRLGWHSRNEGYRLMMLPEPGLDIIPFTADSFARVKAGRAGQPFVLALWSVDCPPCMVELDLLGRMREQHPDLPLVLISVDDIALQADAEDFLLDYGLADMTSWMFADDYAAPLRYSIDPQWFGELPRSYHFDAQHQSRAHSGIMTEAQLRTWLEL